MNVIMRSRSFIFRGQIRKKNFQSANEEIYEEWPTFFGVNNMLFGILSMEFLFKTRFSLTDIFLDSLVMHNDLITFRKESAQFMNNSMIDGK